MKGFEIYPPSVSKQRRNNQANEEFKVQGSDFHLYQPLYLAVWINSGGLGLTFLSNRLI